MVASNYTEEELLPIKEKVKNLIKKFEGEISSEDSFGKKKLSYPIKKNHQGYYLLYEFDLDGINLENLKKELGLTNELLRHIIVKKAIKAPAKARATEIKIQETVIPKSEMEKEEEKESKKDDKRIKLEDLDQKLDEILEGKII
ncbi:MAG: 30S ribosomal protein S6 [Candidatus Omnitrophica bacterium]|nr:30S ribosomal protein S6 [Candidatus Omnitrophota bacterium]